MVIPISNGLKNNITNFAVLALERQRGLPYATHNCRPVFKSYFTSTDGHVSIYNREIDLHGVD
jgi:hypothetical protein